MLYTIGIVITCFLSFILMTKKESSRADRILSLWLFVIGLHLTFYALSVARKHLELPYLLGFEIPLPLLHGPFLFLYIKSYTTQQPASKKNLLHFVPFILALISISPFFFLNKNAKIHVYQNNGASYALQTSIIFIATITSGAAYIYLSLVSLLKHKKSIRESYSSVEKVNLKWLFNLIIGLCVVWIIVFFAEDQYIFSAVVLYILFIGYFGIKQVGIFTNQPQLENRLALDTADPTENIKYEKTSITNEQLKTIHRELMLLMQDRKLYLTPELTLSTVAHELNQHPNTLSQVINRVEQTNFFDFINDLRVAEFKVRVSDPQNQKYTLLFLALECGFNSKTSFNRNFKKITGKSPSEYLKEANIVLE